MASLLSNLTFKDISNHGVIFGVRCSLNKDTYLVEIIGIQLLH